ncbi:MAG TPA: hypothetical protein PLA50_04510 [Bacteroidia bacterium]|nr:hypothetical protein [Bacteroidia bacterium]
MSEPDITNSLPLATGYFQERGEWGIAPNSVLNDPAQAAGVNGVGYDVHPGFPGGDPFPTTANQLGDYIPTARPTPLSGIILGLGRLLDDGQGIPDGSDFHNRYGGLTAWSDEQGLPPMDVEWVNFLLNVKMWRAHGSVDGRSFDLTFPTGGISSFTEVIDEEGETYVNDMIADPPTRRAASGAGLSISLAEALVPLKYVGISIGLTPHYGPLPGGSAPNAYGTYHASPSPQVLMPLIQVGIGTNSRWGLEVASRDKEGDTDLKVTLCGEPLLTRTVSGTPGSYGLHIEVAEFWPPAAIWFGQVE